MTVLMDARYIGRTMWSGRRDAKLKRTEAARLLGVSLDDIRRIENGKICIPEKVLRKLFWAGFMLLYARQGCKMNKNHL